MKDEYGLQPRQIPKLNDDARTKIEVHEDRQHDPKRQVVLDAISTLREVLLERWEVVEMTRFTAREAADEVWSVSLSDPETDELDGEIASTHADNWLKAAKLVNAIGYIAMSNGEPAIKRFDTKN